MRTLASAIIVIASLLASNAYGCDEQCLREQAQAAHETRFPKYLTWAYCEDIRMEFMTTTMRSLESYKENNLNPKFKGGMRNTKSFIEQRKEWLQECDRYLSLTNKGRIFEDEKTTEQIYAAMDSITKELGSLIAGVKYSSSAGEDAGAVTRDKFDTLFKTVDDHKTLMHLKGRYVFR